MGVVFLSKTTLRQNSSELIFRNQDADGVEAPTIDPLVISAMVGPTVVRKVLVGFEFSQHLFKKSYE